jgi:ECF sigma factor
LNKPPVKWGVTLGMVHEMSPLKRETRGGPTGGRSSELSDRTRGRVGNTLQTTALVNEAFLRLVDVKNVDWQQRAQFFANLLPLMICAVGAHG